MLRVVCFKWRPTPGYRSQYNGSVVNTLRSMVARHYPDKHEFVCITDDPTGIDGDIRVIPLWNDHANVPNPAGSRNPSCYRRLRTFGADMADIIGPRFVCLDLDVLPMRDLRPLWNRPDDFVIWGDTARGTPYNGSMYLMTAGARKQVWEKFDPIRSPQATKRARYIGSDQAWIGLCLGLGEKKWTAADGVYSFRNEILGKQLRKPPENARIVMFHGRYDPWMSHVQFQFPWVKEHYH